MEGSSRKKGMFGIFDFVKGGEWTWKEKMGYIAVPGVAVAVGTFALLRYRVAGPNQKIIMTGLGIVDTKACKTGVQWPFQTASLVSLAPQNYTFVLPAMSKEMINFTLPGVFTIGPEDTHDSIIKYAKFLAGDESKDGIIQGVIEGETRDIAANLEIQEIFNGREAFRKRMMETVQEELKKFGLCIYNANIKVRIASVLSVAFFSRYAIGTGGCTQLQIL